MSERIRPVYDMPLVFWQSRHNLPWLYFALWGELLRTYDEGNEVSTWALLLKKAIIAAKARDFAELERLIRQMAEAQNVPEMALID